MEASQKSDTKARAKAKQFVPVETFESNLRRVCGGFSVEPSQQVGRAAMVAGDVRLLRRGRLDIAEVKLDARQVRRDQCAIDADCAEHFFAIMQVKGRSTIYQGDHMRALRPGEFCIVDSSRPSLFQYDGTGSHQVSLHLPRADMLARFGQHFQAWSFMSEARLWFPPIAEVAKRLLKSSDDQVAHHLEDSLMSLMGAALMELSTGDGGCAPIENALIGQALQLIDRHCGRLEYGPALLAQDLGISVRTLQRHFKRIEQTPGSRILEARLERAHELLRRRDHVARITDVAFESGFSDLSHFYRAFRARYGVAPGDLS